MKKKLKRLFLVLFFIALAVLGVRFLLGGDEDTWICVNGNWTRHGNPRAEMPKTGCSNPASVFCEEQGGSLEIRNSADGSQTGWCKFADGRECDEWIFYRTKKCE